jgi:hypothetical protein
MKKLIISLLFFLAPLSAQAEVTTDIFMKYKIHATSPYPDVSSLALGAIDHRYVVKFKYEGGIILDRRVPNKVGDLQYYIAPLGIFNDF